MILSIVEDKNILFSIKFLVIFSIIGGSLLIWIIFPFFNLILLEFYLKLTTLLICFIGLIFGNSLFNLKIIVYKKIILKLYYFFSLMWFIPFIYCFFLNFYFLTFVNKYKYFLDLGWIEYFGGFFFLTRFKNFMNYFLNIVYLNNFFLLILLLIFLLIFIF